MPLRPELPLLEELDEPDDLLELLLELLTDEELLLLGVDALGVEELERLLLGLTEEFVLLGVDVLGLTLELFLLGVDVLGLIVELVLLGLNVVLDLLGLTVELFLTVEEPRLE